jgi:hypothetical protein
VEPELHSLANSLLTKYPINILPPLPAHETYKLKKGGCMTMEVLRAVQRNIYMSPGLRKKCN